MHSGVDDVKGGPCNLDNSTPFPGKFFSTPLVSNSVNLEEGYVGRDLDALCSIPPQPIALISSGTSPSPNRVCLEDMSPSPSCSNPKIVPPSFNNAYKTRSKDVFKEGEEVVSSGGLVIEPSPKITLGRKSQILKAKIQVVQDVKSGKQSTIVQALRVGKAQLLGYR